VSVIHQNQSSVLSLSLSQFPTHYTHSFIPSQTFFSFSNSVSILCTLQLKSKINSDGFAAAPGPPIPSGEQDLRRLFPEESAMGVSVVRSLYVLRVLRQAPRPRRPHLLRSIRHHGFLVRNPDQEDGSWRQR